MAPNASSQKWTKDLFHHFVNIGTRSKPTGDCLVDVVVTCEQSGMATVVQSVVSMLVDIQLHALVESIKRRENIECNSEVYERFLKDKYDKRVIKMTSEVFKKRCGNGALYASLAGAGTLYFLFLIAGAECKTLITNEI
ncbi:hypothetical protein MPER_10615, partial [Moniliophthora perniciosa FA553]